MMDEFYNLRMIPSCGADTDEWMDDSIRWGVAEIERLRTENARLEGIAENRAKLVANWQWSAQQMRTERNQLKEINDRMAADRERLIAERDKTIRERDSLARRCYVRFEETKKAEAECSEWKERYINAGVEAELKIQRGWPDFRDTVAELDIARQQIDEWTQAYSVLADVYDKDSEKLRARIRKLEADSAKLNALEAAGVDNWEGYDHAMDILEEDNE